MIINESGYNPLPEILKLIPEEASPLTTNMMRLVNREMFKAGFCCENNVELEKILSLMGQCNIITLSKMGTTFYVSKYK